MTTKRRALGYPRVVLLIGLLLVATSAVTGAAATDEQSAETKITVNEDGEIVSVQLSWEMDAATYDRIYEEREVAEAPRDELGENVAGELILMYDGISYASGADIETDDGYVVFAVTTDVDGIANELEDVSVTAEDGAVRYEGAPIPTPVDDADVGEYVYDVVMPAEIADTNATTVTSETEWRLHAADLPAEIAGRDGTDRNMSSWTVSDQDVDTLSAEAIVNAAVYERANGGDEETGADDETTTGADGDGTGTEADDGLPGFGVVSAVVALLTLTAVRSRRRG